MCLKLNLIFQKYIFLTKFIEINHKNEKILFFSDLAKSHYSKLYKEKLKEYKIRYGQKSGFF